MKAKKILFTRKAIIRISLALFIVFVLIAIVFGAFLLRYFFQNIGDSKYDLYYYTAVVFSSLAFGITTLALSLENYKHSKETDKQAENKIVLECRKEYAAIISTREFRFVKEIFDQISDDYNFTFGAEFLDTIETKMLCLLENDFSNQDVFIEYIESYLYLVCYEGIDSMDEEAKDVALVTIVANETRSLLYKFSPITSQYVNGILYDEFEYDFLDGILSVHLMSVILQNFFSFYCENAKVRSDLKIYFEHKVKMALEEGENGKDK